jgi:glycosyltransferase involved in cell wall biosynthesis
MLTVCEADRVPPVWVECANAANLLVVPSEFCRQAFMSSGVGTEIMVVPHGVWHVGHRAPTRKLNRRMLHVAGAASYPDRKGTAKLLRAFAEVSRSVVDLGRLDVIWPKPEAIHEIAAELGCDCIRPLLPPALGYAPDRFAALVEQYDAVINPSRAEGFGIIPLEARCLGVPAIITSGTGHAEHFQAGIDVAVESSRSAPIHVQGNAIGSAPTVSTEAIANALRAFHHSQGEVFARTVRWSKSPEAASWHWLNVLAPFIRRLRQIRREVPGHHRLGAATGLGEG